MKRDLEIRKRNISLDILKLILSFFIVGLHTNFLNDVSLIFNNITVNGIFRLAVPIFFIINGFFFYSFLEHKKIKNWIKRILSLYLIWMLVYGYFWIEIDTFDFKTFSSFLKTFSFGFGHLWYLAASFQAAIMLYLLRRISENKLLVLSSILFVLGLLIQYANAYETYLNLELPLILKDINSYRNFLFFAFPFFSLGYIINKKKIQEKISKQSLYLLLSLSFILLVFESNFNLRSGFKGGFDFLLSLYIICPIVFIIAIRIPFFGKIKTLGLFSNAIYLSHILILILVNQYSNYGATKNTFIILFFSIILSFLLVQLQKKIKFII